MKNKMKLLLMLVLAASVAVCAGGCDKLKKNKETEKVTEAPTEKPTEAPTEEPTEKPTEKQTEAPTEPPTESETQPKVLTPAEEKAQETQFDQIRIMYAKDDVNVREQPDTSSQDNIFYSYYQGDQLTVVGETPNWYVVDVDDYEANGYMSKQFVSDTKVEPKTDEEREQVIQQELGEGTTTPPDADSTGSEGTDAAAVNAAPSGAADTAAADAKYNVQSYAESYPVYATTGANLRAEPAQDSEIIKTVPSGSQLTAIGYTDKWYKVDMDGTIGYVNINLFSTEPQQ